MNAAEHCDCHFLLPSGRHGIGDFAEICKSEVKHLKPTARLQQYLVVAQYDVGHSQSSQIMQSTELHGRGIN